MIKILSKHLLIASICASATVHALENPDKLGCIQSIAKRVNGDNGEPTLVLSSCELQDQDIPAVINFLNSRSYIRQINLAHNNLTDVSLFALANIPGITTFVAGYNNFTDTGMQQLVNNKKLERVYLDRNQITDKGAKILATLPYLSSISLADNNITDAGAAAIAESPRLNHLYLDDNDIGPRGAMAIAATKAKYIVTISLNNNHIGDQGAKALLEKSTLRLFLAGNHITDESALSIQKTNSMYIDLSHNELTDKAVNIILADTSQVPIDYLSLDYNHLTKAAIEALEKSGLNYSAYGNDYDEDTTNQMARVRLFQHNRRQPAS